MSWQAFNKRVGQNFFQNLINGQALKTAGRLEFFLKINKRTCPFIREVRVGSVGASVAGMNEDGSFIGKYRKDRNPDQSSAFATLV